MHNSHNSIALMMDLSIDSNVCIAIIVFKLHIQTCSGEASPAALLVSPARGPGLGCGDTVVHPSAFCY
jgi:hypothetical protein